MFTIRKFHTNVFSLLKTLFTLCYTERMILLRDLKF